MSGGKSVRRHDEPDACPPGTALWVPRTKAHLDRVVAHFGAAAAFPFGIYGVRDGCGGGTQFAMNSDSAEQAEHWKSVAYKTGQPNDPWFLRDAPFSEPNGDYTKGCFLGRWQGD